MVKGALGTAHPRSYNGLNDGYPRSESRTPTPISATGSDPSQETGTVVLHAGSVNGARKRHSYRVDIEALETVDFKNRNNK